MLMMVALFRASAGAAFESLDVPLSQRCQALGNAHKYSEGIQLIEGSLKSANQPTKEHLLLMKCNLLIQSGKYDEAKSAAEAYRAGAIQDNDHMGTYHSRLGWIAQDTGDFATAAKEYEMALRLAPEGWASSLAIAYILSGQPNKALRQIESFETENHTNKWLANTKFHTIELVPERLLAMAERGRKDECELLFAKLSKYEQDYLKLDDGTDSTWMGEMYGGLAAARLGNFEAAKTMLTTAVKHVDDMNHSAMGALALSQYALLLASENDFTNAELYADKAMQMNPNIRVCQDVRSSIRDRARSKGETCAPVLSLLTAETRPAVVMTQHVTTADGNESLNALNFTAPIGERWAVVVGLSKFSNANYALPLAAKDGTDFANFLVNDCHFAQDHVKTLIDERATLSAILDALGGKWLPSVAKPNDLVIVYLAGRVSCPALDESSYLLAYDSDAQKLSGTTVNLNELLKQMRERAKAHRIVVIIDGSFEQVNSAVALRPFNSQRLATESNCLLVTTCSTGERSYPTADMQNRSFVSNLMSALHTSGKGADFVDALRQASRASSTNAVELHHAKQTPELTGNWSNAHFSLGAF